MPGKIFHFTPPLEPYAWPGGYQILYLVTDHKGFGMGPSSYIACPSCATKAKHEALLPENRAYGKLTVEGFVNWEGPAESCEDCGEEFPSEYGNPDEGEEE